MVIRVVGVSSASSCFSPKDKTNTARSAGLGALPAGSHAALVPVPGVRSEIPSASLGV